MKRGVTDIAHGIGPVAEPVRLRLRDCQQQVDLVAGFLARTGMTLDPERR